ncbi:hypothetical protein KIPB_012091 [Kipferlia bialata]|uniref:Uncharacterized protein n=1 Tax=Kipferlia bialata TaxID=797122 RepID=A0A9K3D7J2_9EUKA|nr:hypothetical protein KIPB_012091 [Kipferlia bialata]|eukprot:g12091.t1
MDAVPSETGAMLTRDASTQCGRDPKDMHRDVHAVPSADSSGMLPGMVSPTVSCQTNTMDDAERTVAHLAQKALHGVCVLHSGWCPNRLLDLGVIALNEKVGDGHLSPEGREVLAQFERDCPALDRYDLGYLSHVASALPVEFDPKAVNIASTKCLFDGEGSIAKLIKFCGV